MTCIKNFKVRKNHQPSQKLTKSYTFTSNIPKSLYRTRFVHLMFCLKMFHYFVYKHCKCVKNIVQKTTEFELNNKRNSNIYIMFKIDIKTSFNVTWVH